MRPLATSVRIPNPLKRYGFPTALALSSFLFSAASSAESVLSENDWSAALGRGYDSHLGRIADGCVSGKTILRGSRSAALATHFNESFDSYMSMTEGKLSGSVNLLLVSGSASVDYYSRVSRSDNSTSLNIRFVAEMGSAVLEQRVLTPTGDAAALMLPAQRRKVCGDEYIGEAKLGSELQIAASFHFADESEMERFAYTVKVEAMFGLISSTKRWTEETSSFAETGYLVVDSLQRGGDVTAHQAILNSRTRICPFYDVSPCWELLRDLIDYAKSPNGYNAQFSTPYRLNELALVGFRSIPYDVGGHDTLAVPSVSSDYETRAITAQLIEELGRQRTFAHRATFVLAMPISGSHRTQIEGRKLDIDANIAGLARAIWVCQTTDSVDSCRAARDAEATARRSVLSADLYF